MTNHLHLILSSDGLNKQEDIIRDFKKYTAKKCLDLMKSNNTESRRNWMLLIFKSAGSKNSNNSNYQFWQQNNHSIELNSNKLMDQKLKHIHNNLVVAGIVDNSGDYIYSSARNYEGLKGLINVAFIE